LPAAARHMASAPRIGRSSPESESSPANSWRSRSAALTCPDAIRMPSAMGRSKRPDSLGRSAGARFTVMQSAPGSRNVRSGWRRERGRALP
jgi:hypothetical protein